MSGRRPSGKALHDNDALADLVPYVAMGRTGRFNSVALFILPLRAMATPSARSTLPHC